MTKAQGLAFIERTRRQLDRFDALPHAPGESISPEEAAPIRQQSDELEADIKRSLATAERSQEGRGRGRVWGAGWSRSQFPAAFAAPFCFSPDVQFEGDFLVPECRRLLLRATSALNPIQVANFDLPYLVATPLLSGERPPARTLYFDSDRYHRIPTNVTRNVESDLPSGGRQPNRNLRQ